MQQKRISLIEKHKQALETKDFYTKSVEQLSSVIKNDNTGSFWDKDFTINKMLEQATILDKKENKKSLYGLTFGAKDLFCVKDYKTTAGSKILENFVAPYTADVVSKILNEDALLAGKLAMDEFAMGSYSNTAFQGKTTHPKHLNRTAGGSSGGSASALQHLDFTIGSDTGGSVRQPASFCGSVGFKPSYGSLSRYGMLAYASSLDQAGLLTHNVKDLSYIFDEYLTCKDPKDMTHKGLHNSGSTSIKKVGYFPHLLNDDSNLSDDVKLAYSETLKLFKPEQLVQLSSKYMSLATEIYYIIACAEASSNLAKFQGVYFGANHKETATSYKEQVSIYRGQMFGAECKKRIMLGSFITSSEHFGEVYEKACLARLALSNEFKEFFNTVDTLVLPTTVGVAPTWDEISLKTTAEIYLADYLTVPFSLAGIPAISLPLFQNKDGLDIGMQFVGAKFMDYDLIKKCEQFDK